MKVYAFKHTSCIYESAHAVVSLHRTKRGAFKAMVRFMNQRWQDNRDEGLMYGLSRGLDSLQHEAWCIREMEVIDD